MSLQVWLPLNGSLKNQGLLDKPSAVVLQSGNSFTANGKIGQCLSSTSTNVAYFQDTSNNKLISLFDSGKIYSMAFWYKLTGNGASGSIIQIGTTTPSSGSGNGTFGFWWTKDSSGTNPRFVWNDGDNGKRILSKANDNSDIATDYTNWHHLVAIIDKTNMTAQRQIFYIDGIKVRDQVYNNSSANALTITNANNYIYLRPYYALLNDIRIYDHALSDKEVEEISKGLILHYKLDSIGSRQGNPNLGNTSANYSNQTFGSASNASSWGGDAGTVTYYASGGYNNLPYKVYHKTATGSGGIYRKTANDIVIEEGKTYTFSCWIKSSRNYTESAYGFNINRGSDNNYINYGTSLALTTEWKLFKKTFTATSAQAGSYGEMSIIYDDNVTDYYVYYSGFKIEEGSEVTAWVDPRDNTQPIIYDSSGYKNNGTILSLPTINNDSIRYNASIQFDGTDDGILIENLQLSSIINDKVTYSFWIKPEGENGARSIYFGSYSGTSWSIEKTSGNLLRSYWNGSPDITCSGATISDGIWQHICIIKDGNTVIKVYINGILKYSNTSLNLSTLTFPTTYRIGRDTRSGDGTPYKGKMSDFRIYSTALTEAQVKELYNTSGTIDNNGNIYTRELVEI